MKAVEIVLQYNYCIVTEAGEGSVSRYNFCIVTEVAGRTGARRAGRIWACGGVGRVGEIGVGRSRASRCWAHRGSAGAQGTTSRGRSRGARHGAGRARCGARGARGAQGAGAGARGLGVLVGSVGPVWVFGAPDSL